MEYKHIGYVMKVLSPAPPTPGKAKLPNVQGTQNLECSQQAENVAEDRLPAETAKRPSC